jgi:hypothetical protein
MQKPDGAFRARPGSFALTSLEAQMLSQMQTRLGALPYAEGRRPGFTGAVGSRTML